ncbi:PhnD/SsuA/transferrin family substrate-binding protein [Aquibium oceanicum]|uniref:Phosphonate ABC transporter substrate-binding protein n=1 Tax=Aquibium oceanicum TaxID=1670800 RepID=A0A1L3SLU6_9HYPH|nr:PhnD/SsuA/transferrin family substrate-binding protein [Aquibium oceanicum]APH70315.1 hypothetical protein BSQ44_02130 [Aquibium oceanicum]
MIRAMFALVAGTLAFAAGACSATWAQDTARPAGLRIGMLGAGPAIEGASAIERAYAQALGMPVTVFAAPDFPTLIEAQVRSDIDYAIYSASAYAVAWKLCGCIEPLVAPSGRDGASGVKAVLIRRKGASGPGTSTVSSGPRDDVGVLSLWGAEEASAPTSGASTSEAEKAFLAGETQELVGWVVDRAVGGPDLASGTLGRLTAAGLDPQEVEIAWRSDTLRFGPHAVRKDLPGDLKTRLRNFLVELRPSEPDLYEYLEAERQGGFVRVSPDDYMPAVALVEAIRKR